MEPFENPYSYASKCSNTTFVTLSMRGFFSDKSYLETFVNTL